jgi:GT2 family glycosyltransferase
MMFFDDDFVPCEDYLASFERIMVVNPDVVLTTGRVLKDGILGPGLAIEVADDILAAAASEPAPEILETAYNGYGCNMGVRLRPVREHGIGFDERLALYGWLEDVDFSRHLARFGRVVSAPATRGVHLGVKLGRQPGLRLGYSQIANPVYLIRKGTMSPRRALRLMVRNLLANACRVWRPEPWVDRSGRLHGNLKAVFDLALGRLDPARVASL